MIEKILAHCLFTDLKKVSYEIKIKATAIIRKVGEKEEILKLIQKSIDDKFLLNDILCALLKYERDSKELNTLVEHLFPVTFVYEMRQNSGDNTIISQKSHYGLSQEIEASSPNYEIEASLPKHEIESLQQEELEAKDEMIELNQTTTLQTTENL